MSPLLERSDELGALRENARLAVAGSPRFVVIEGPAGIGKTSLLDEFGGDGTVLRVRCDELAQANRVLARLTAGSAPVLLAVDDVHLADEPALRRLLYLARHLVDVPLLMVLTRRTGRHQAAMTELALHPRCTVLRPGPLGVASTSAVLEDLLGLRPAPELVRSCHGLTAGNPLLTRALGLSLSGLSGWDGLAPPASAVRVVSDILLAWLSDLTADAQEFARALAVLGDTDDVTLPARLAGLGAARGGAACDELWQAGFVDLAARWTCPLARETVLNGMGQRRRRELHAAAARLPGAPAHRVCAHLLQSPPGGDPWVVRTLCTQATQTGSPELAATYLRRAMAEPPAERERAAVLVALGMAESYARPDVAVEHLTEAIGRLDDPATLGRVGRCVSDSMVRAGRAVEAVELLGRLSAELIDRDREAGVLLRAHRTVIAVAMAPHLAEPGDLGDVSELAGNTVAERAVLGAAAFAGAMLGATADRTAELALRALPATSSEMANPSVAHTIRALSWTDQLAAAAQRCDVAIAEARRCNALFALAMLLDSRAVIARLAGDLGEASALAQQSADTMRPEWWGVLGPLHHGTTLRILVDSGDTVRAQRVMASLDGDTLTGDDFPSLFLNGVCAAVRIASGDVRGGLAALLDCGDRLVRAGYENPIPLPWRLWGVKACVRLGEFDTARQLATEALEHARHWGTPRAIGGALHALGTATSDLGLVHEGVEALESSPARLELAQALDDLGTMQHDQGLHREARDTLRRARRGRRPATGLAALTESERRIAELATRWSNRKIAEELHLTLRTVETHLSATYRKLGITGRPELPNALKGPISTVSH